MKQFIWMLICYFTLPLCANNIGEIHPYNNSNSLDRYNNQQNSLVLMQENTSSAHVLEKKVPIKNTTPENKKAFKPKVAIDTKKKVWPKKMLKLYPNTNGGFWSILNGGGFQMLLNTEDANYLSFNVHVYKGMSEYKSLDETNTETQSYKRNSLGFGVGYATYTEQKGFKSFIQHLATITFNKETTDTNQAYMGNNTNNNKDTYNEYRISYDFILGVEKEIVAPFSAGIETTLVNFSLYKNKNKPGQNSDINKTQYDSKTISLDTMSEFRVYGKINL
jgi:hypothetical protein